MCSTNNSILKEIAEQYGIKVKESNPATNNEIKELYRCIKMLLSYQDEVEQLVISDSEEVDQSCERLDTEMSNLQDQLCELRLAKRSANKLGDKFVSQYENYLEAYQRYREWCINFSIPYEKAKNETISAKAEYDQEIARLGSLEEKYQNRDKLAELRSSKENLDEEETRIDEEIQETKVRIHEYQRILNPELLVEYKRLKGEFEMHSLLSQIDISSLSLE